MAESPLIYALADALGQARLDRVDQIMKEIRVSFTYPGSRPLTSNEMKQREDRRHQIATSIKLNGGKVQPDYE